MILIKLFNVFGTFWIVKSFVFFSKENPAIGSNKTSDLSVLVFGIIVDHAL